MGPLPSKGTDTLVKLEGEMIRSGVTFHRIIARFSYQMGVQLLCVPLHRSVL